MRSVKLIISIIISTALFFSSIKAQESEILMSEKCSYKAYYSPIFEKNGKLTVCFKIICNSTINCSFDNNDISVTYEYLKSNIWEPVKTEIFKCDEWSKDLEIGNSETNPQKKFKIVKINDIYLSSDSKEFSGKNDLQKSKFLIELDKILSTYLTECEKFKKTDSLLWQIKNDETEKGDVKANTWEIINSAWNNQQRKCEEEKNIPEVKKPGNISNEPGSFKDVRDGKSYKVVKIGNQFWMAENLSFRIDKDCWSYQDDTYNTQHYGLLYNWEAANKACPSGWHLPSDAEWTKLTVFLGDNASYMLKETGNKHWTDTNEGATNETGFSAIPGGGRNDQGQYGNLGVSGFWWSSTEYNNTTAWSRNLNHDKNIVGSSTYMKKNGFSVRCIKD
ncbi:MAG: FISUMP domain-containing protein [Bacteroidota bacterium]